VPSARVPFSFTSGLSQLNSRTKFLESDSRIGTRELPLDVDHLGVARVLPILHDWLKEVIDHRYHLAAMNHWSMGYRWSKRDTRQMLAV